MLNDAAVGARVAERLVGFPGFLRANGFAVGADAVPTLQTAQTAGVLDAAVLRWSLQALLCGRADEWRRFPELFDAWFLPANRWQAPAAHERALEAGLGARRGGAGAAANDDDDPDTAAPRDTASREERLASADFRTLTEREHLLDIEALMRRFARELKPLRLRRHVH